MDHIFSDLSFVTCYIDDIVIASQSAQLHMEHVSTILHRLDTYGLVVNAEKSEFGLPSITFLGFEIGP